MADKKKDVRDLLPELFLESDTKQEFTSASGDPDGPEIQLDMIGQQIWRVLEDGVELALANGANPQVNKATANKFCLMVQVDTGAPLPDGTQVSEMYTSKPIASIRRRQFFWAT